MGRIRGARNRGRQAVATIAPAAGSPESGNGVIKIPEANRLGDFLVDHSLVSSDELAAALRSQLTTKKRLGELLVEQGAIDDHSLAWAIATWKGIALADLRREHPEPAALSMIPENVARQLTAIPLRFTEDGLEVVVTDPWDQKTAAAIAQAVGGPVRLLIGPVTDIRRAVDRSYRAVAGIERHIKAFEAGQALRVSHAVETEIDADAPVIQVVNLVITQAVRDRASDVHIEPQDGAVRVRCRTDGVLHELLSLPGQMGPALISRIKIMAGMNIVERRRSQDGQIAMDVDGRPLDIRVATTATIWGEKVVLRLLDKSKPLYRLEDLGMPMDTNATFSKLIRAPFGMVIVAGPTGSGKTTTLYATLRELNQVERNIMTIEDPVEYIFPSINQVQINEQAGITFAGGLKAILRQDPDVILVGEVRDVDTARIAVQAALTGHLVLSSLHATDAPSALQRFLDMGIESFLIASSVTAIVSQRLVRRICKSCMASYTPTPEEWALYKSLQGPKKDDFWHGEGCNLCSGTGYHDRVGVFETLPITDEVKELIVQRPTHDELRKLAVKQGMRLLQQEAVRLVAQNVTTISEIMRALYVI